MIDGKSRNKLGINLIATVIQMSMNYGIAFLLTPYIVNNVGTEAYGFVNLGNNMINYASIITIALNSVAGRFITISIHQGKKKEANIYFNSVLWANIILAFFVAAVFTPIIIYLDSIFDISAYLVHDVKVLFLFIVINFMLTIASNVFTVSTFVTNQLYLTNLGNCIGATLRICVLVGMFKILPTNIAYVGVSSLVLTIFTSVYNIIITIKSDIGIKIAYRDFSLNKIRELILSGIWSSVTKLSQILSDGLDLLICNKALSASVMGSLSVAYTIPTIMASIIGTITNVFSPQQTYYYAKDDTSGIVREIKINMKMIGFFVSIIIIAFVVYGKELFALWTPKANIELVYKLAVISCVSISVTGVTSALNNIFLLTNHLKENSIFWLCVSAFDIVTAILLVKTTPLGVFAIAGVSKIVGFIVNLTYVPIYASKCLKIHPRTFYPIIFHYWLCLCVLFLEMSGLKLIFNKMTLSWGAFLLKCIITGLFGVVTNFIIFLNSDERSIVIKKIKKCKNN